MTTSALGESLIPPIALDSAPALSSAGADVVVLPFERDGELLLLGPGADAVEAWSGVDLLALLARREASGRAGEIVEHARGDADDPASSDADADNAGDAPGTPDAPVALEVPGARSSVRLLLVGVGSGEPVDLRRAGAAVARRARGATHVAVAAGVLAATERLRAFVEGFVLGSFTFHRRTTDPTPPAASLTLAGLPDADAAAPSLAAGLAGARAGWRSRALALTPSNEKSPAWLADRSVELAAEAGLEVTVWDEHELADRGFGGLLAVGAASHTPPRLVRLHYVPAGARARSAGRGHVVLVGKGITFDTGGLSIKPAEAMSTMKRDMTGAGAVLAAMAELAAVGCSVEVTALLACAENAVGGSAMRPGDIVRHVGGRTTEVTNTDAEGRLVMADALAYAAAELDPTVLVDVATLTGAMKVALGQRIGGLFATDDALADLLLDAGASAGEPLWRMPLSEDYVELLDSPVADADNAAGGPGAITAALFLRPFAAGVPWAHLDIASVGDSPVDAFEWTQGATGFGARALLHWLGSEDPLAGIGRRERRRP